MSKKKNKGKRFYSYRFISKKHIKILLPEGNDASVANDEYAALYQNIPSNDNGKSVIRYLKKDEKVAIINNDTSQGYYFKVSTEDQMVGYVNAATLEMESDGVSKLAYVRRPAGFSGRAINVFLSLYGIASKTGEVTIRSLREFSRIACVNHVTLYSVLHFLEECKLITFIGGNMRHIQISDFSTRDKDGYFQIRTKYLAKKFMTQSVSVKRIVLYILSLQNSKNLKVSVKKLMVMGKQNTHYKLRNVIQQIEELKYFDFTLVNGSVYEIEAIKQKVTMKNAREDIGIIFDETMNMMKKAGLLKHAVSDEDKYMLAYNYNRSNVTSDLFMRALVIARKNISRVATSLPFYVKAIVDSLSRGQSVPSHV